MSKTTLSFTGEVHPAECECHKVFAINHRGKQYIDKKLFGTEADANANLEAYTNEVACQACRALGYEPELASHKEIKHGEEATKATRDSIANIRGLN